MAGGATGKVSLVSNAQDSPTAIALSGNGLASPPAIKLNPLSLTFGDVYLGVNTVKPVTISNTGSAALVISKATINGTGFSISGLTAPVTIAGGESKNFNVSLLPTVAWNFYREDNPGWERHESPSYDCARRKRSSTSDSPSVDEASVPSTPPELLVKTSDGVSHVYSTYTKINSTQYSISDPVIDATLTNVGGSWKLILLRTVTCLQSIGPGKAKEPHWAQH